MTNDIRVLEAGELDQVAGGVTSASWQMVGSRMMWVTTTNEPGHVARDERTMRPDGQGGFFKWDAALGHEVKAQKQRSLF